MPAKQKKERRSLSNVFFQGDFHCQFQSGQDLKFQEFSLLYCIFKIHSEIENQTSLFDE